MKNELVEPSQVSELCEVECEVGSRWNSLACLPGRKLRPTSWLQSDGTAWLQVVQAAGWCRTCKHQLVTTVEPHPWLTGFTCGRLPGPTLKAVCSSIQGSHGFAGPVPVGIWPPWC